MADAFLLPVRLGKDPNHLFFREPALLHENRLLPPDGLLLTTDPVSRAHALLRNNGLELLRLRAHDDRDDDDHDRIDQNPNCIGLTRSAVELLATVAALDETKQKWS